MKRFLKVLSLLVAALLLLVSGVDSALGHLAHLPGQSVVTWYSDSGSVLLVYNGDLSKPVSQPEALIARNFLHRACYSGGVLPETRGAGPAWF